MDMCSIKMAFGFLVVFSTWTSFISGKPYPQQQPQPQHQKESFQQSKPKPQSDYELLQQFVDKVKTRISLGANVAEYKWVEGQQILDVPREKIVLEDAEKTATEMKFSFKPEDRQFFVDLMEATKLIEYVLVSNWYKIEKSGNTPTKSVDLTETRNKITGMKKELIELLFNLKGLQNSKECQPQLARAIYETQTENDLTKIALQRAFGNYCTENIQHKS